MNIAFLSFYSGMNNRGVERWVYDLASRLSEKHSITVYQNKPLKINVPYGVFPANLKYQEKDSLRLLERLFLDHKSVKVLQFTLKVAIDLLKNNYDVIIPTDGGWEPAIVRIITWIRRKKMVIVGHAGIGCDDANNLWSFPNTFVALSSTAQKWARRVNPFVKTVYIPDGVDTGKFTLSGKRITLPFKNNYPIALCVGALEKGKRIDLAIKAVSRTESLNLLVCGRGELREELSELGNKLLGKRFELKQYDFDEIPAIYRSCDLLVSASLPQHSFEMVLLEAMATGLPVVANDDPIRKEIVGNGGLLVDVTDISAFADIIKIALKKDWGDEPRLQSERFDWDVVVIKYEELFNSLII